MESEIQLFELPVNGPGVRTLSDPESDRLTAVLGVQNHPHPCITCGGAGTFRWWDRYTPGAIGDQPQGFNIVTYRCPCEDQWILHRWFSSHGLGVDLQRLSQWDAGGVEPGAMPTILDYNQNLDGYVRQGLGLVLYGSKGAGKTLSASIILKRFLARGGDGFFVRYKELLDLQSQGWKALDRQDWLAQRVLSARLLVIDDVGKEFLTTSFDNGKLERVTTGLSETSLDSILRSRGAASLATILTTNLELDAPTDDRQYRSLEANYSDAIRDLLLERAKGHRFTGESYRQKAGQSLRDQLTLGLSRPVVTL